MENFFTNSQILKYSLMKFRLILLLLLLNACAVAQKTTDKKADALFIEAMRYMNYGEYNAAQVNLEKALARDNGFLDAKINLAQLFVTIKNLSELMQLNQLLKNMNMFIGVADPTSVLTVEEKCVFLLKMG